LPDYKCTKEGTISAIEQKVNSLDKEINGEPRLRDTVTELKVVVKDLSDTTKTLATSVSALVKFQTEVETEKKLLAREAVREQKELESKQDKKLTVVGMIVVVISSAIGYIINILTGN